jgi:hypothetical protein
VTQYESIIDPDESWLEKWLLHEAAEVYNYWGCVEAEGNPRIKRIWERFLDYELGHFQLVRGLFEDIERRDAQEVLPAALPMPIEYTSQRAFVREVLASEIDLRAEGPDFVSKDALERGNASERYAGQLNSEGSPSQTVAAGYVFWPGGELAAEPDPEPELRSGGRAPARRRAGARSAS